MRIWYVAALALIAACATPASTPVSAQTPAAPQSEDLVGGPGLLCTSAAAQGGAILCRAAPGAHVSLDGKPIAISDANGLAVIGLKLDEKSPARISVPSNSGAPPKSLSIEVAPRHDSVSKISLDCNKILAQTPEEKEKASRSWLKKDKALKTFSPPLAPVEFAQPVAGVYSSSFGATRTYVPKTDDCKPTVNVHHGTDIAVPTGTEIHAPMAGTVILADPDLYYEGGCVFLDLGRGLVSVTMHMSRLDVKPGDVVKQGELLGLSGATGRVTGPHLHWAIKYRNVFDKDRGSDLWLDPMLLMKLNSAELQAE
ncbi:MAG: peptidoglycan DD-metalloendopeptidase family protein [Alphaproteobacteria bacterium]|nr:peptidoglycan DD-metalloendopeptidase family protein [Alphaproteobacteria bacterium]